jgi:hypothetical protein
MLESAAKLLSAISARLTERARASTAGEDLGGGMFDQDVVDMKRAAASYLLPQTYSASERELLDTQLANFEAPPASLKKFATGTKLYKAQIGDTDSGLVVRVEMEVRAPVEQAVAYMMGLPLEFGKFVYVEDAVTLVERRSDHCVFMHSKLLLPAPLRDRDSVALALWERLDENTYFVTQTSHDHPACQPSPDVVRLGMVRNMMLTRVGPKLTRLELVGSVQLNGAIPRSINDSVTFPAIARAHVILAQYFVSVRPADGFNDGDARALGRIIFFQLFPNRHVEHVLRDKIGKLVAMTNVLRAAQTKYR